MVIGYLYFKVKVRTRERNLEVMKEIDRLNIVMLGHKRIPSREGGIEVVVEELSTRMVQRGHSVTCFNRSGHHVSGKEFDVEDRKKYMDIRLKNVPTFNFRGFAAMTSSIAGAVMSAFGRYDIVHFHAEGPCAMLWIPKIFGKKCICTIHGLDWQRAKWGKIASAYIMIGEKCAAKFADEIIVLSEGVKKYFKDTYGRDTKFIPNGVNRSVIREANIIKEKFDLKKDSYILYLGRIVPEKGLRYLIKSYINVKTDKKLVIAGGSSDSNDFLCELQEIASCDERIIFTGFIQGKMLDELYSNSYVYVLPSDLEGMPLSLLEAMSYGNCCLVSDIDECTSVVEDKAVIFKRGDVGNLTEKLQRMCDDTQMVYMYKEQAKKFIYSKYNWNDVVDRTLVLYQGE